MDSGKTALSARAARRIQPISQQHLDFGQFITQARERFVELPNNKRRTTLNAIPKTVINMAANAGMVRLLLPSF